MMNYACDFNQSEMGKYFEWIIIHFNNYLQGFLMQSKHIKLGHQVDDIVYLA